MTKIPDNLIKLLIFAFLLSLFFIHNLKNLNENTLNYVNTELLESKFIEDEIYPYCDNIQYANSIKANLENLETLNINLVNKSSWYTNLFDTIEQDDVFIFEKNKKNFKAEVIAVFKHDVVCKFDAKIRLSGDFQDHIRSNDLATSLDVRLENGHIDNIVSFKLFLPESRRGDTEFVVTSIMEKLNFLTPRTIQVESSVNNQSKIQYIFQEKVTKEFLEHNSLRESVLLETNEEFMWEKRKLIESDNIPFFGKILNKNWANLSQDNQKVALDGLSKYNRLIMQSDGPYLNYNIYENNAIHLFDTAMYALDGHHGLAIHNRKFYFDKFSNKLIPIYYDSDSQISSRKTLLTVCNESIEVEYERIACVNNFASGAYKLLSKINFDSDDLFSYVKSKNKNIEKEFVNAIYVRFINNLYEMSELGNLEPSFKKNYFLNFQNKFEKDKDNKLLGFYFVNNQDSTLSYCNSLFSDCIIEEFNDTPIQNSIELNNKSYYLLGYKEESLNSIDHQHQDLEITKNVTLRSFNSPPNIKISKIDKTILIEMTEDSKILFFGSGELRDWSISILGSQTGPIFESRQDSNLITGCTTFLNLHLQEVNITTKENTCEDALNFINVSGSIKNLFVENSYSDGVDIDFSNLTIQEVEVNNSGNDCLDISFSNITLVNFVSQECTDKAISIGEKSLVNIQKADSVRSKILMAIKDSSKVNVNVVNGKDIEMCIAMYRKKQEFGPSELNIKSSKCNAINQNFIQIGQEVKIEG